MKTFRYIIVVAFAVALTFAFSGAAAAQSRSSDLLTKEQVKELTANAKTTADHMKLARHYTALAARYDNESADHAAIGKVERTQPNPAESKRPGAPGTALHCERLADNLRTAATEARAIAASHEEMAKSTK